MTAITRDGNSPITKNNPLIKAGDDLRIEKKTAWFAKANFIRAQRITSVSLIALGLTAMSLASITQGISAIPGALLIGAGGIGIGASLIQQVIGGSKDAQHGKVKRVAAGALIMLGGPIGWLAGGVLWYLANKDNNKVRA